MIAGRWVAAALAALVAASARADEAPWHGQFVTPPVRAVCDQTATLADPPADLPTAAEAQALADCDSAALYYGIGRPADPVAARRCAYLERRRGEGGPGLAGDSVLAMIYAHGQGVRRDYDQAIRLSCRSSWAEAELDARVAHLLALKARPACAGARSGPADAPGGVCAFDFCDDITSGAMGGVCSDRDSRLADAARQGRLAALQSGWTTAQKAAFAALVQAMDSYAELHGRNETDLSGTLRGAFILEAEDAVKTGFEADLKALQAGRVPAATAADLARADAALNSAYRTAMAHPYPGMSGITPDGVRAAERAWLAYRDAFLRLAAARFPAISAEALKAKLTRDRTGLLTELAAQ